LIIDREVEGFYLTSVNVCVVVENTADAPSDQYAEFREVSRHGRALGQIIVM
jgi:hypothetical protein